MKRRTLLVRVSVIALAAAGTAIYVAPLAAEPTGPKDCGSGAAARPRRRAGPRRRRVAEPQLGAARRDGQRRQLPQPHRGRRHRRGRAARPMSPRRSAYARAHGLPVSAGGREAFDGRPGLRAGRRGARHARARTRSALDPARAHGHGRRGRDLARHPERDPPALRGQGDAIDRHLHRRRLDLGQRPRHGPSRRGADGLDPLAARHARRRQRGHRLARRESRAVPPCRRRLRPVRDRALGRARGGARTTSTAPSAR